MTLFCLIASKENIQKQWCVCTVKNKNDIVYRFVEKFQKILYMPGLLDNPELCEDEELSLSVDSYHKDKQDAENELYDWICRNTMPLYNKLKPFRHKKGVMCLNTGQTWVSQVECCYQEGICASQLNKHLRGFPGHKTVKGKIYKFI